MFPSFAETIAHLESNHQENDIIIKNNGREIIVPPMNLQIDPLPTPENHRPEPFSLSCEGVQQEEQVHTPRWLKNQTSKLKNRFEHVGVKPYVFVFFSTFFPRLPTSI
jgi:hypothetical protein